MILNGNYVRLSKEIIVAHYNVPFWHLPRETEKHHENP
jgi:hypothetical protein